MAIPVVFEPGSSLSSNNLGLASTSLFKMIVKGNRLKTDALPAFNNDRPTPGLQGDNGRRFVSRTKIKLDIFASLLLACNVSLGNV